MGTADSQITRPSSLPSSRIRGTVTLVSYGLEIEKQDIVGFGEGKGREKLVLRPGGIVGCECILRLDKTAKLSPAMLCPVEAV